MQIKSLGCLCTPHERSLLQLDARDCCQDLSGHVRICQEYQLSKISQGFIPCSHTKQNMAWTSVSASNVTSLLDQFISTWKLLVKIIYSQVALTCCLVGWYLKPIIITCHKMCCSTAAEAMQFPLFLQLNFLHQLKIIYYFILP